MRKRDVRKRLKEKNPRRNGLGGGVDGKKKIVLPSPKKGKARSLERLRVENLGKERERNKRGGPGEESQERERGARRAWTTNG